MVIISARGGLRSMDGDVTYAGPMDPGCGDVQQ